MVPLLRRVNKWAVPSANAWKFSHTVLVRHTWNPVVRVHFRCHC